MYKMGTNRPNEHEVAMAILNSNESVIKAIIINKQWINPVKINELLNKLNKTDVPNNHLSHKWPDNFMMFAAYNGNKEALIFGLEHNMRFSKLCGYYICKYGHLSCLELLVTKKWSLKNTDITLLAFNGHTECLKYLYEHGGYKLTSELAVATCRNGHIITLQFLIKAGVEITEEASKVAAINGHVNCLEYLFMHGRPIDKYILTISSMFGQLECLKWAYNHAYGWDEYTYSRTLHHNHTDCLKFLEEHECPKPDKIENLTS